MWSAATQLGNTLSASHSAEVSAYIPACFTFLVSKRVLRIFFGVALRAFTDELDLLWGFLSELAIFIAALVVLITADWFLSLEFTEVLCASILDEICSERC